MQVSTYVRTYLRSVDVSFLHATYRDNTQTTYLVVIYIHTYIHTEVDASLNLNVLPPPHGQQRIAAVCHERSVVVPLFMQQNTFLRMFF